MADEFSGITCSSDIPHAVVGNKMTTGKARNIEAAHKDIALKDLGSDGMPEDPYITISWEICGREYVFLKSQLRRNEIINDVLAIPSEFIHGYRLLPGSDCTRNEKRVEDIYAIAEQGARGTKAKIKAAWKINRANMKFVKLASDGIDCKIGD